MGGIFGKEKKKTPSRVTDQDKAVFQLKQQRDKIKQYQKRIEIALIKDKDLAKQCISNGRKDKALLLLRKKKYQEKLLETTDKELEGIERLTNDLEFAQVQQQVLEGLKTGNEALKRIHEVMTIDEVERIMDETREGVDKQKEIDEILSGALSASDEDDVTAELDEILKQSENVEHIEDANIADQLPDVPIEDPERIREKVKVDESKRVALEA